ncbi:MAG: tetratricopeptide repeat protein [Pseudomonadota bacterium]|nr:tetratricopeptide repeat protein [Pseudomonadota bacterium]
MATLGLSEAEQEAVAKLERDVIEPSMTNLVLLDFWAGWCGPCKQLSPVLEKIAADYAEQSVKLVKIDVDKDKVIAAQFRVQSLPTVYAFYQGQPVADLTNYRTEGQLTRILDQLLQQLDVPAAADAGAAHAEIGPLLAMGEEVLAGGDSQRALSIFRQAQELAPDDPAVVGGLVRALVASGDTAEARTVLDALAPALAQDVAVARARAALDLAEAAPAGSIAELEQRVASNPDDLDARFELAGAAMAADRDQAADNLFEIIARDKDWNEGAARKRLLQLLEAQSLEDPWARAQRRRLSALLFT